MEKAGPQSQAVAPLPAVTAKRVLVLCGTVDVNQPNVIPTAAEITIDVSSMTWQDFRAIVAADLFQWSETGDTHLQFQTMEGNIITGEDFPASLFPESLGKGNSKAEATITVHDTKKGRIPVRRRVQPKPMLSYLRALASQVNFSVVFQEIIENSMEGVSRAHKARKAQCDEVQSVQTQSVQGTIAIDLDEKEKTVRIWDTGCGMHPGDVGWIVALGGKTDRSSHPGSIKDMLSGVFGDFGQGMKTLFLAGQQEKQLAISIKSKTAEAQKMVLVVMDYAQMLAEDEYCADHFVDVDLDSELFALSASDKRPLIGAHGTLINAQKVDAMCFAKVGEVRGGAWHVKAAFLAELAGKYYLYMTRAMGLVRAAIASDAARRPPQPALALPEDEFPFALLVNGTNLHTVDNVVRARLLHMLADLPSRDAAAKLLDGAVESKEEAAAMMAGLRWKQLWSTTFTVSVGGPETGDVEHKTGEVLVVLYYTPREEADAEDDARARRQDDTDGEDRHTLLAFWNGLYFKQEKLDGQHTLPFIANARKRVTKAAIRNSFDRVRGFVFLSGDFDSNTSKTELNKATGLGQQLLDGGSENRLRAPKAAELVQVVEQWYKHDLMEEYGGEREVKLDGEASNVHWEHVKVHLKPARGNRGVRERVEATLLAAWKGRSGSYVVARVKDHEQCKFMGEIRELVTRDLEPSSGRATIQVPFGEARVVPVANIEKVVSAADVEEYERDVKKKMPHALKMHVFLGARDDEQWHDLLVSGKAQTVGEGTFMKVTPPPNRNNDLQSCGSWKMTADEAREFQVMVEMRDSVGQLVKCLDERKPTFDSHKDVLDLKNLTCRIRVTDHNGREPKFPQNEKRAHLRGIDWFDLFQTHKEGEGGALFFSEKPLHPSFLRTAGKYQIHFSISFQDQRFSVRQHLQDKFGDNGLARTLEVEVLPGKPSVVRLEMELSTWLGSESNLRMRLEDGANNVVTSAKVKKVHCSCADAALKDLKCVARVAEDQTSGVHRLLLSGWDGMHETFKPKTSARFDFEVEVGWKNTSTLVHALKGSQIPGPERAIILQAPATTELMSGIAQRVIVDGDHLRGPLPRWQPLQCRLRVLDKWGNVFVGAQGKRTLTLQIKTKSGGAGAGDAEAVEMLEGPAGSGLKVVDIEQGEVQLPERLAARVCGHFGAKATVSFLCATRELRSVRGRAESREVPAQPASVEVEVEQAALVFVTPQLHDACVEDDDGTQRLELGGQEVAALRLVHLQVHNADGERMRGLASDARHRLTLRKVDPGGRSGPAVEVEVRNGRTAALAQISSSESSQYVAEFLGLTAALHVKLSHGSPHRLQLLEASGANGHGTRSAVSIGKEWTVHFKVFDDKDVLVTDSSSFAVSICCSEGLQFEVHDDSLVFDCDTAMFSITALPTGLIPVGLDVCSVDVRLTPLRDGAASRSDPMVVVQATPIDSGYAIDETTRVVRGQSVVLGAGALSSAMSVSVSAGAACRLRFVRDGMEAVEVPYVSGEHLGLQVQAVDEHGNVDKTCNGNMEIAIRQAGDGARRDGGRGEAAAERGRELPHVQMKGGLAELAAERHATRAERLVVRAELFPSKKRRHNSGSAASASAERRLDAVECRLDVSKGAWASEIVVKHPNWDPVRKVLEMDDEQRELTSLRVWILAHNGARILDAQAAVRILGAEHLAEPSADAAGEHEFRRIEMPPEAAEYQVMLFVKHANPPCKREVLLRRSAGQPTSLSVSPTDVVVAGKAGERARFAVTLEVKNRLGVTMAFKDLDVFSKVSMRFNGDGGDVGVSLRSQQEGPNGKYCVELEEEAAGLVRTVKGTVAVTMTQRGRPEGLAAAPIKLTYIPWELARRSEAQHALLLQRIKDANAHLTRVCTAQRSFHEQLKLARGKVQLLEQSLQPGVAMRVDEIARAQQEKRRQQAQMKASKQLKPPNLFKAASRPLSTFLGLQRNGRLPAEIALHVMGVVGELGYVDQGDAEKNEFWASGISALAGSHLQAVVVDSERGVDLMDRFPECKGIGTLVLANPTGGRGGNPRVDARGYIQFPQPPPAGSEYAVNLIEVAQLTNISSTFKADLRRRLWHPVLGNAVVFRSEAAMEQHKDRHGRTHKMTARRLDNSWRTINKSLITIAGSNAPRAVELPWVVDATKSAEYRQLSEDLLDLERQKASRQEKERELRDARQVLALLEPEEDFEEQKRFLTNERRTAEEELEALNRQNGGRKRDASPGVEETPMRATRQRMNGAGGRGEGEGGPSAGPARNNLGL